MPTINHRTSSAADNPHLHRCKEEREPHSSCERGISLRINLAKQALAHYMDYTFISNVIDSGFNIVEEPFFFQLLRCIHKISISDLCSKSNIPVEKGCLVTGIPDYSYRLGTDQIFLQISEDGQT